MHRTTARLLVALLTCWVAGCEDEAPSERPEPPAHIKQALAQQAATGTAATDGATTASQAGGTAPEPAGTGGDSAAAATGGGTTEDGDTGGDTGEAVVAGSGALDASDLLAEGGTTAAAGSTTGGGLSASFAARVQRSDDKAVPIPPGVRGTYEYDAAWPAKRDDIIIAITSPTPDQIIQFGRLAVRVTVTGFETFKTGRSGGNHLRVLLDNETPRDWYDPNEKPLVIEGLAPGQHTLRIFPMTPWGESIKGRNSFASVRFYVGDPRKASLPIDLAKPTLSHSNPVDKSVFAHDQPVLVDFFVTGCQMKPTGCRVRMTLDQDKPIDLVAWAPLWLRSIAPGKHRLVMQLRGADNEPIVGPYNEVERRFTVEPAPAEPTK